MRSSEPDRQKRIGLATSLGPLALYMIVFFIIPVGVFFVYSFWTVQTWNIVQEWNINNYVQVFSSPVYTTLILRSIRIGLVTAVLTVLLVYPLAYAMVFRFGKYRDLILFLLTVSLFVNYLVRVYAWRSLLSASGLVNWVMIALGLAIEPHYYLLYSPSAVILVLMNVYIPYAVLPIYSALLNVDRDVIESAGDLGAGPLRAFREVTLPLSMSGVVIAFLFIFLLSAGDFVTPELVGGMTGMMIGNAVQVQFGVVSNWPLGSAMIVSTVMVFLALFASAIAVQRIARLARRGAL